MDEAIKKFIKYLENEKHYSKQTVSSYNFDLLGFNNYLKEVLSDYAKENNMDVDKIEEKISGINKSSVFCFAGESLGVFIIFIFFLCKVGSAVL